MTVDSLSMIDTDQLCFMSHKPEETWRLGARIGELASPGDIFLLMGTLGAGKTCLTQGIARGLGIAENVMSPSFVLVRELKGRLPLYHIDLYRLERIEEVSELGLDDYLYGQGVSVIEWAERGLPLLPEEHLLIELKYVSDNERSLKLRARGERYRGILSELNSFSLTKGQNATGH